MSYTPFNWLPRQGQGLNKFTDQTTGQVLTLNSTPDSITQEGTPFSTTRMNALEQGLGNVFNKPEQLTAAVAALFGFPPSTVPNDIFNLLSSAALYRTPSSIVNVQLGALPEGSIIYLNENGSPVQFYVAKHDYESSLNGTGRTLVVRKDTYNDWVWASDIVNAYATSNLDSQFNSTYKNMLDADVRSLIGTTKIRYTPGNGNNTVGTLERDIFALSLTELGHSHTYANTEGSALPIASTLRIAYRDESATIQWTRSPYTGYTNSAWMLDSEGSIGNRICNNSFGSRPAFTLPADFTADTLAPTTGLYDVLGNLLLTLPGVQIETGSYVGTGTYGRSNPNSLTFGFEPKLVIIRISYGITPYGTIMVNGQSRAYLDTGSSNQYIINLTWGENGVSWYGQTSGEAQQLNYKNATYYYAAIG